MSKYPTNDNTPDYWFALGREIVSRPRQLTGRECIEAMKACPTVDDIFDWIEAEDYRRKVLEGRI